ncbi:MAG: S-layer homology domain-containing protein, partial [Firmicutes bacterium]|nr:S-layer homology domain-containing protein [Bacillota bacterium]
KESTLHLVLRLRGPFDLFAGSSCLVDDLNTSNAATVWFGQDENGEPYSWNVIGYDGNGFTSAFNEPDTMTLLAKGNIYVERVFDVDATSNVYADSDLKIDIDGIAANLTVEEAAAIKPRTLVSGEYQGNDTDCVAVTPVENAMMWPLSTKEAVSVDQDLRNLRKDGEDLAMYYWWLRSPGSSKFCAATVLSYGDIDSMGYGSGCKYGVRPAFNIDLRSVLFTSAAEGGKSSAAVGSDALTAVSTYSGNEWKLTLLDGSRSNFTASFGGRSGDVWTIQYSNAKSGTGEYISAVIKDSNGAIKYYGNLGAAESGTDRTVTVNVAGKLGDGDTLWVFNEQCNGDKKTDYASDLIKIVPAARYTLASTEYTVQEAGYTDIACSFSGLVLDTIPNKNVAATSISFKMKSGWLSNEKGKRLYFTVYDSSHDGAGDQVVCAACDSPDDTFPFSVYFDPDEWDIAASGTYTGTMGYNAYWNEDTSLDAGSGWILLTVVIPGQVETPVFDPADGTEFEDSLAVSLSCITADAAIYYTMDDSDFSKDAWTVYTTGPAITLTDTATLRAIAVADGCIDSEIAEATYTKTEPEPDPQPDPEPKPQKDKDKEPEETFPFTDVPEDAYYRKAVEWAVENGITGGVSATEFGPEEPATRAQMITFLWAASGCPEPVITESPFEDVAESDYFYKAVLWAYEQGITSGVGNGLFGSGQTVTRGQAAVFLYGVAGRPVAGSEPFADVSEEDYYEAAVAWAYGEGITSGTGETTFSPGADCLRCQIITFMYLYFVE